MLNKIKTITSKLLFVVAIIEIFFFFNFENVWATIILLSGWFLISNVVLTKRNMINYPVTFLMFFGLSYFHFVLPIPLTLIELKPVTYNLTLPFETFLHHGLYLYVLVFTHFLYTNIFKVNPFRQFLKRTIYYKTPSNKQIWISSVLALSFSFYFYYIYGSWENYSEKNIFITLGKTISIFLWMPMILPFVKVRNSNESFSKNTRLYIVTYFILVTIIAIISNWRTILFTGVVVFFTTYIIGVLYGYYTPKNTIKRRRIPIYIFVFWLFTGPIMDLGTAMVVMRQTRYTESSEKFLAETLNVYADKEKLNDYRELTANINSHKKIGQNWDEVYLDNYVLNRFSNMKISDNCIYYANKIGYANPKLQVVFIDKILSFIPGSIASSLDIETKTRKEKYQSSITDNLYSIAINNPNVKGSAIIGSIPGLGLAIFGYWYLLVIIPIFTFIFLIFDSFARPFKGKVYYSYYFFTSLFLIINFFNDRHVFTFELRWILRTYFESTFIFIMTYYGIIKISQTLFKTKNGRK
tara:strand:+ start:3548 stop:5119 length:1572 start_codon:yes stop_codon:yes gene_type:complete